MPKKRFCYAPGGVDFVRFGGEDPRLCVRSIRDLLRRGVEGDHGADGVDDGAGAAAAVFGDAQVGIDDVTSPATWSTSAPFRRDWRQPS